MKNILKRIDWVSTLFLTLTPVAAVIGTIYYFKTEEFNYWLIPVFLFFYFATGMSITGGYHRLIAHCAYQAHPLVKFFYLFFGAGAFQNSARKWVIDHRFHHRYVDTDRDPYSINKGFWYAHFFWMCDKDPIHDANQEKIYSRDLDKDPLIVWQHKYYYTIAIFSCFVVPMLVGWAVGSALGGLVFAGFVRMVLVHHFTFFINSLCHFWGSRPYTDTNTARDNMLAAIFTYGEGYHNFHHIFHADYRNGIRWYQFDPTKWMIKGLEYCKMTYNLRVTPEYEIFKAKMQMAEKKVRDYKVHPRIEAAEKMLEIIKQRADEAYQRLATLRSEYETIKFNLSTAHQERMERLKQLKRDIQQAKREFRMACRQWSLCIQIA